MLMLQRGVKARIPAVNALNMAVALGDNNQLYVQSARNFAKRGRKKKSETDVTTEEEDSQTVEEQVAQQQEPEPEPVKVEKKTTKKAAAKKAAPANLDQSLYQPFSVGDVKRVDSTPGNKPTRMEDTIEGRYAFVLFTTASQNEALFNVYEDMIYLRQIYKNSEEFRQFTENQGVGYKEVQQLNQALKETAPFHDTTLKFLQVLAENKRLIFIAEIAEKFEKLYQEFNKEEKITIISAEELNQSQKSQVLEALRANPDNSGKEFTIEYQVDGSILGGLQMYTESEFMDMSLSSRVDRITQEIQKLVN